MTTLVENLFNQTPQEVVQKEYRPCCSTRNILPMVPGILATVTSLVGIVALNVLKYHYFSIAFAVGTLVGSYTIYQGYRIQLLKSFQENNTKLETSVISLNEKITMLQNQRFEMEKMLKNFRKQNKALQENLEIHKLENSRLHDNLEQLTKESENLHRVNSAFEENAKLHVEKLQTLTSSLKEIEEAVFLDHSIFGERVAAFKEEVNAVQQIPSKIDASISKPLEQIQEFGLRIENIFSQIQEWKNPKAVEMKLNDLQLINSQLRELTAAIAKEETRAIVMKENIQDLAGLEVKFRAALEQLKKEITELDRMIEQKNLIVEGVRRLVQEVKELPSECILAPKLLELIQVL